MTCKSSCSSDSDCQSASTFCSGGVCVAKGSAGATCAGNNQCTSGECGTTGTGHCCTASCPATVATCGATNCDGTGACVYPGNTVAPPSLQAPGDCQKMVCDGSGGKTSVDDMTDIPGPSGSACLINPSCQGSPLAPHYDNAPTGTPCTLGSDPAAHVCGDTTIGVIAGTCVECNTSADCLAVNDAGTLVCNTSMGLCQ
jgi:hypothetical protein